MNPIAVCDIMGLSKTMNPRKGSGMKIGMYMNPYDERYARLGDKRFEMFAASGFEAVDYNIMNTDSEIYTCEEKVLMRHAVRFLLAQTLVSPAV